MGEMEDDILESCVRFFGCDFPTDRDYCPVPQPKQLNMSIQNLQEGPIDKIAFTITGAKEQETNNGNKSQMVFVTYEDGEEGFALIYNQPEVTDEDEGITHLYMSVVEDGKKGPEMKGVQLKRSKKKKLYPQIGVAALRFVGSEISAAPSSPPPRGGRSNSGSGSNYSGGGGEPFEDMIKYGMDAICLANLYQSELPGELQASIFGSAMYAFKEGRPLRSEQDAPPQYKDDGPDDDEPDDVPF